MIFDFNTKSLLFMNIKEKELDLINRINFLEEWEEKYQYIIDYTNKIPIIEEKFKTDEFLVRGCQSNLWLQAVLNNKKIQFYADCDAEIPKGLAAMLIEILSESNPKEIIEANLTFLKDTGIIYHLSPNRVKGFNALVNKMKEYAIQLK